MIIIKRVLFKHVMFVLLFSQLLILEHPLSLARLTWQRGIKSSPLSCSLFIIYFNITFPIIYYIQLGIESFIILLGKNKRFNKGNGKKNTNKLHFSTASRQALLMTQSKFLQMQYFWYLFYC